MRKCLFPTFSLSLRMSSYSSQNKFFISEIFVFLQQVNPLPNDKMFDWPKLKAFAETK